MNIYFLWVATTGLDPKNDEAIGVGITNAYGKPLAFTTFRPVSHSEIDPSVSRMNGIDMDLILRRNSATLAEKAKSLEHILRTADLVVCYNAAFTKVFLPGVDFTGITMLDIMDFYASLNGERALDSGEYIYKKFAHCIQRCGIDEEAYLVNGAAKRSPLVASSLLAKVYNHLVRFYPDEVRSFCKAA